MSIKHILVIWTFLEGHFNCWIIYFEPYSLSPRRMYSSDNLSFALYLWNLVWEYLIIICFSSDPFIFSDKTQSPIYDLGPIPYKFIILGSLDQDSIHFELGPQTVTLQYEKNLNLKFEFWILKEKLKLKIDLIWIWTWKLILKMKT